MKKTATHPTTTTTPKWFASAQALSPHKVTYYITTDRCKAWQTFTGAVVCRIPELSKENCVWHIHTHTQKKKKKKLWCFPLPHQPPVASILSQQPHLVHHHFLLSFSGLLEAMLEKSRKTSLKVSSPAKSQIQQLLKHLKILSQIPIPCCTVDRKLGESMCVQLFSCTMSSPPLFKPLHVICRGSFGVRKTVSSISIHKYSQSDKTPEYTSCMHAFCILRICCCRDKEIVSLAAFFSYTSVQDGIYALGETHMSSTLSLRRFLSAAFETVPTFVWLPMVMYVWLTMVLFHPFDEDRRVCFLFLDLSPSVYSCFFQGKPAEVVMLHAQTYTQLHVHPTQHHNYFQLLLW